ncbi:hypothetical protein D3C78_1697260 [compost metagenome]
MAMAALVLEPFTTMALTRSTFLTVFRPRFCRRAWRLASFLNLTTISPGAAAALKLTALAPAI